MASPGGEAERAGPRGRAPGPAGPGRARIAELEGAEGAEEGGGGLRERRRGPGAGPRPVHVENVDGAPVPAAEALRLARRYFWAGCLGLPWLWFTNVWLFWPELKKGAASGSEVRPCASLPAPFPRHGGS